METEPTLKTFLLQQLVLKKGEIITAGVSVLTGFIVWLMQKVFKQTPDGGDLAVIDLLVSTTVAGVVGWVTRSIVAWQLAKGAAKVQNELAKVDASIEVDGVPGPNTQASARELVQVVQDANTTANLTAR